MTTQFFWTIQYKETTFPSFKRSQTNDLSWWFLMYFAFFRDSMAFCSSNFFNMIWTSCSSCSKNGFFSCSKNGTFLFYHYGIFLEIILYLHDGHILRSVSPCSLAVFWFSDANMFPLNVPPFLLVSKLLLFQTKTMT